MVTLVGKAVLSRNLVSMLHVLLKSCLTSLSLLDRQTTLFNAVFFHQVNVFPLKNVCVLSQSVKSSTKQEIYLYVTAKNGMIQYKYFLLYHKCNILDHIIVFLKDYKNI